MTYSGIITIQAAEDGSKSDGRYAHFFPDDGGEYILYRSRHAAMNDAYFAPFDGQHVAIEGEAEDELGYLCVASVLPMPEEDKQADGTPADEEEPQTDNETE